MTTATSGLRSAARSHPGTMRATNEDRVLDLPQTALWAVADGMGGHAEGALAAETVVAALAGVGHGASGHHDLEHARAAITHANTALIAHAAGRGPVGATVVLLLIRDGHYACAWAGDARGYRLRWGTLTPLTRDHSVVQALVDAGALTGEEAAVHPQANLVTRAVGVAETVTLDVRHDALEPGDRFLLCSDGLTRALDEMSVARVLADGSAAEAADALLGAALAGGAEDNVTLVVVDA